MKGFKAAIASSEHLWRFDLYKISGCVCIWLAALLTSVVSQAHENELHITEDDYFRYIESNGIPDHETGTFPNWGNPNRISEQSHRFRIPLNPEFRGRARPVRVVGIAINGVPMEPGTAEAWGGDPRSGWNVDAMGMSINLGLDQKLCKTR